MALTLVQSKSVSFNLAPSSTPQVAFDNPVTAGNLILTYLVIAVQYVATDNNNNVYTDEFNLSNGGEEDIQWAIATTTGPTTITFNKVNVGDPSFDGTAFLLEFSGVPNGTTLLASNGFSDSFGPIPITTTLSNLNIISLFYTNGAFGTLGVGAESTLALAANLPYTSEFGVIGTELIEFQQAPTAGVYNSSFTGVGDFVASAVSLAFGPVPVPITQIPLSTSDKQMWTSDNKGANYFIPNITYFDATLQQWIVADTGNTTVDPAQIVSTWQQDGLYRAVNIGNVTIVQMWSGTAWVNQYVVDPNFTRPEPTRYPF